MSTQQQQDEEEEHDTPDYVIRNGSKGGMTLDRLKQVHDGLQAAFPEEDIGDNVDILVLLNFAIFVDRLAEASEKEAKSVKKKARKVTFQTEQGNQNIEMHTIRSIHIEKCAEEELRKMRG